MPQTVAIIPARLGSTRLPGKVLLNETGGPLIRHVWESARAAKTLSRVVIATDDERVRETCIGFGAECVMTRADHPNGTSRLSEASTILNLASDDLVVNVQGDEPEVEREAIDGAVDALLRLERVHPDACIGTVAVPFGADEDPRDPNCVKVVLGLDSRALYFSRSLIPFDRDDKGGEDARAFRHVGLYVYRKRFLDEYVGMASTSLERCEQLEQLRALQHGRLIAVAVRPAARIGIDTPEQYNAFVQRWKSNHTPNAH
jgi:3-deoxy-manno-octulosonate cytidylyltransferase (CMP-KDO synthetase)